MSPENPSKPTKICPTCGTRLSETAARCTVCGRTFVTAAPVSENKKVQAGRLPEVRLSLPLAIALFILLLALGAGGVYLGLSGTGKVVEPTVTVTPSTTPTVTVTPMPTSTATQVPTATALPPLEYTVKAGDVCSSIALRYQVSVQSIAQLNNLPPDCGVLTEGQKLLIPQPTPTPSPMPTSTLSAAQATDSACGQVDYQVASGDTLSTISANYNIDIEAIKAANGLTSDTVFEGMNLKIPLCQRRPTAGPTPTPTPPPPYPAPNLLLPADGSVYASSTDAITLQWASVGTLRENELYQVTVEDLTSNGAIKLIDYVTDTKFIVPTSLRPTDGLMHIFRWTIMPVRNSGSTKDNQPIYEQAGASSAPRVFGWSGSVSAAATPTP